MRYLISLSLIIAVAVGCSSSRSTLLTRNDDNTEWKKIRAHGVPITIKVPTHLKVYVYDKHFLQVQADGAKTTVGYMYLPVPLRDFATDFVYTEKVVMVDFKRPAAGAFNLEVDFTEDQYIKKIQHDITDETIQRVSELVSAVAPQGFFTPSANEPGATVEPMVKEIKSVAAVGMFEVDAPDFEHQVTEFLNCHLNKSHDAWVAPPGVKSIHRPCVDDGSPRPDLCPAGGCFGDAVYLGSEYRTSLPGPAAAGGSAVLQVPAPADPSLNPGN